MDIFTNADLDRAEVTVAEARRHYEAAAIEVSTRYAKKQAILDRATAADTERGRLDDRRRELLPRLRDDDPAVAEELNTIRAAMVLAQQSATDLREVAALCDPDIDAYKPAKEIAHRRLGETEYRGAWLRHVIEAQTLEAALAALAPRMEAYFATAAAFEQEHLRVFNAPLHTDMPPQRRFARFVSGWLRSRLGHEWRFVINPLPPDSHSLVGALDLVRPEPARDGVTVITPDASLVAPCG